MLRLQPRGWTRAMMEVYSFVKREGGTASLPDAEAALMRKGISGYEVHSAVRQLVNIGVFRKRSETHLPMMILHLRGDLRGR